MEILIWIVFCILVGVYANDRPIGPAWAIFWSIMLSPLVGFLIAYFYKRKEYNQSKLDNNE